MSTFVPQKINIPLQRSHTTTFSRAVFESSLKDFGWSRCLQQIRAAKFLGAPMAHAFLRTQTPIRKKVGLSQPRTPTASLSTGTDRIWKWLRDVCVLQANPEIIRSLIAFAAVYEKCWTASNITNTDAWLQVMNCCAPRHYKYKRPKQNGKKLICGMLTLPVALSLSLFTWCLFRVKVCVCVGSCQRHTFATADRLCGPYTPAKILFESKHLPFSNSFTNSWPYT